MGESNDNTFLILTAISDLRERVEDGFDKMNGRVRTIESEVTKVKTVVGVLGFVAPILAFFGWGTVKVWLTTLMKS